MRKLCVIICLLLLVVFVGQVDAWQEGPWTVIENSYNKDSYMRQVQLTNSPYIERIGIYKNKGDYLLEFKVQGYNFSIIYNTTDMTIWGMIFPGSNPNKIGFSNSSNDITIERKDITKTCFARKCWNVDRINIQHIEDDKLGWCPFQIDFIPVSAILDRRDKEDRPLFQKVYWGIITFRGFPEFFGPKTTSFSVTRFMQEGSKTWSEQKQIKLWRFGLDMKKFLETSNLTPKDGTPANHLEPETTILIYDKIDTIKLKYKN